MVLSPVALWLVPAIDNTERRILVALLVLRVSCRPKLTTVTYMINYKSKAVATIAISMLVLALGGCQKEGPAEKAGKQVDKTLSNASDKIESAVK